MNDSKRTGLLLVGVFFVALIGCIIGCTVAIHFFSHDGSKHVVSHDDAHHWLHDQLGLTEDQLQALIPIEEKFAAREAALKAALSAANTEVGTLLIEDRAVTPRVQQAVDEVHKAMAELQKATLDHVVEMEDVLTPDQYSKLLNLAGDALSH